MRILLCHNYYLHPGGESEVFEAEAKGLRQNGQELIIYTRQNVQIEKLPMFSKVGMLFSAYYSVRTSRDLKTIIQKEKPDIALVQNVFPLISPSIYMTLADAEIPIVQSVYNYRFVCPSAELYTEGQICERCVGGNTAHAVIHRCYRESYVESAWYASIIGLHRYFGTFARRISSFMVPDEFLGTKLVQGGIPSEKIWRNPNPFFVEEYQPKSSHNGYVLYVGRLTRQKGILTLLNAMERTRPESHLLIIGLGELAEQVKAQIDSAGLAERASLLGARWGEEVTQLIQDCAAVVIPSEWYDNLPMILCRANAMGKPVIASRINGIPEYVRDGENGFLFKPGDASELAGAIDRILGLSLNDYASLSAQSRVFAEKEFDYANHFERLMNKIRDITK